jgi:hypothetical protein
MLEFQAAMCRPRPKPGAMSRNWIPKAGGHERKRNTPASRLSGLRWVPVPLALLAAVIGAMLTGTFQGQVAAANAALPAGYKAGGLELSVNTMLWMMNMKPAGGYQMPSSMMPGLQSVGDDRLRVEVNLSNVSTSVQRYSDYDFTLAAPGGKSWHVVNQLLEHSDLPTSANLQPGFATTIDLYFDVPAGYTKHLTLEWSRGGTTVPIPVNTSTGPGVMHM